MSRCSFCWLPATGGIEAHTWNGDLPDNDYTLVAQTPTCGRTRCQDQAWRQLIAATYPTEGVG